MIRDQLDRDGVVILKDFFTAEEVNEMLNESYRLLEFKPECKTIFTTEEQNHTADTYFLESSQKVSYFFEEDQVTVNKIGHNLHGLNPVFKKHIGKLRSLMNELNTTKVVQSMIIYKHKNVGGKVNSHLDATFVITEPDSVIGYWVALEDATIENGCLWYVPGTKEVTRRFVRNGDKMEFRGKEVEYPQEQFKPVEVKKGTLVLIHGSCVHKSELNKSEKSRVSFTCHAVSEKCEWSPENWIKL